MIKIQLFFTTSKTAAYIILLIGTIFSFIFKDSNTLIATFSAVSAILMMKTFQQSQIVKEELKNNNIKNENELG